jgi:serine protease
MLLAAGAASALVLSTPAGAARPDGGGGGGQANDSAIEPGRTYDRFIVHFGDAASAKRNDDAARGEIAAVAQSSGHGLSFTRRISTTGVLLTVNRELSADEARRLMARFVERPSVSYVEPDSVMQATLTPNDSQYLSQWHYYESVAGMNLPAAWDTASNDGAGVVVAVVDTGITTHSDLSANVVAGYDFITNATAARDGNGRDSNPQDQGDWYGLGECIGAIGSSNSSWHGTHVAGTVAAVTNNASGVAGTAYNARILPVRVLGRCGGETADIVDAITWASGGAVQGVPDNANPAEVINMSLGGGGACGAAYQQAITAAVNRGTTVVVAAGNQNADAANHQPASCANVINVASITSAGARSGFSNYGASIDVAAPGSGIYSTINTSLTVPGNQGYGLMSGTSMAAPHVAGVVALLQSAADEPKTPAEVEQLIRDNASGFPADPDQDIGAGILNADAVVDAVAGVEPPPPADNTLTKGVAVTNLSAAAGAYVKYKMVVPAGATNLTFTTSSGAGDADMYVRFGAEPTDATYDCRPYRTGNAETCTFAAPQAGTYYVNLKAYTAFNGVSLVGNYATTQTYSNTTDYAIADNATVDSSIVVAGRTGNAPSNASVTVAIAHTYQGDLKVDLVAPDGSLYNIHNRSGGSADNINKTVALNLSTEALNGTWKLRVNDNANGDVGKIDSWSVTF